MHHGRNGSSSNARGCGADAANLSPAKKGVAGRSVEDFKVLSRHRTLDLVHDLRQREGDTLDHQGS